MVKFPMRVCLALLMMLLSTRVYAQDSETIVVFAAASLSDAFEEVAAAFQTENPNVEVLFNFAGSSDLAAQLAEGAPADVFASANARQMNVAREAGRIGSEPRTFVKNRLVVVLPADNPASIQSLRDLANLDVRLVLAAPDVPVRDYTETLLERLAADPAYGEAYRSAVLANIVSEEPNVRQVAAKVALGEADVGIVYISDVTPDIADEVTTLSIPDTLNTIATYPIAVTDNPANPVLAQAFVDFVLSDAGQDILEAWNFLSVRIPELPAEIVLPEETGIITVDGQVSNPLALTADDLRTQFSAQSLDVSYLSGEETVSAAFTGVPLWQVISVAQPNLNADVRSDALSMYLVVTGSDGYQAVISWGEIDPTLAGQPILLAYEQNGAPLEDALGPLQLVVPTDARGGRYVRGVVNISLRDAPPVVP